MDGISKKILISIIAYKEKDLAGTVKDAYDKAKNKDRLLFSIVDETYPDSYADLSFIPARQILYRKYDLSEYRGILWARSLTTENNFEYDYILYICAHTRFTTHWDDFIIKKHNSVCQTTGADKSILSFHSPFFSIKDDGTEILSDLSGPQTNIYFPDLSQTKDFNEEYAPGYWFPRAASVPADVEFVEANWVYFTWCFGDRRLAKEMYLDPSIAWAVEEIFCSIQAFAEGWRVFSIPEITYYHHSLRKYPEEDAPRNDTHRPWSDHSKNNYWNSVDASLLRLNLLMSGRLPKSDRAYVSPETMTEFCEITKLNPTYTEYNENYHKLDKPFPRRNR